YRVVGGVFSPADSALAIRQSAGMVRLRRIHTFYAGAVSLTRITLFGTMWQRMFSHPAARIGCFLLLLGAIGAPVRAQSTQSSDPLEVYLVTIGPGDEVWEKFGHNMIIIAD